MNIEVKNTAGNYGDDTGLDALANKLNIALLEAVREGEYGVRAYKKMVVRRVFPTILAARKTRVRFDEIAEILNANGLDIKTTTLRVYFFELMNEESGKAAIQHSNKVVQMRKFLDMQNARDDAAKSFEVVFNDARPAAIAVEKNRNEGVAPPAPERAVTCKVQNSVVGNEPLDTSTTSPKRARSGTSVAHSGAMPASLDEVERRSMASEDHAVISQDIIVKEGYVFLADGTPFTGTLNKKHLFLLKTNGRIIAESKGRTSDKAVKIRDDV